MMDQGEIEFSEKIKEESVNMITDGRFFGEASSKRPRPLTIFFEDDSILTTDMTMDPPKLTIEVPSPFPYTDSKMVPWNYNYKYNYVNELTVASISCIGGMT